ncbi:MAG: phosphoribosylformylglycinamidine cyclo-ligase [Leptospiraceae bacterium]|nr:MAG: phosphoribosylformylglycinamidine cyclo-ligase [Leptospiraceae bacterium]
MNKEQNKQNEQEYSLLYKDAGVDTLAGQSLIQSIIPFVRKTYTKNVISDLGGFSAIYDLSFLKSMNEPVLLTSTDGVGTKLTYASYFKRFDTIGYDLVAMCANDILVSGGKPEIFLDYIAVGKLKVKEMSIVIRSIAAACKMIDCSLTGGETAEHPIVMKEEDFDLAGFMIGFCEKKDLITGEDIQENDVIVGIPSSGVHSNGISLIRKLFYDPASEKNEAINKDIFLFLKESILLQPTVLYDVILREFIQQKIIKGMVHITGGGYQENIPRILKENYYTELSIWELQSPFKEIANMGNLDFKEMTKVFNCGYGMLVILDKQYVDMFIKKISEKLAFYKEKYISIQREFFQEFPEWEKDWKLPHLSLKAEILGTIKKDSRYNKKVVFI